MIPSLLLGLMSAGIWLLAPFKPRLSACLLMASQIPWDIWDWDSGNKGFLILTVVSVISAVIVLRARK